MRSLLAFLEATAGGADPGWVRTQLLAALADLFPCEIIFFKELDQGNLQMPAAVEPIDPAAPPLARDVGVLRGKFPSVNYYVEHRDGRVVRFSDEVPPDQRHPLAPRDDPFRPLSVERQVTIVLPAPEPVVIGLACHRSRRDLTGDRAQSEAAWPNHPQHAAQANCIEALGGNLAGEEHELVLLNRNDWSFEASDRAAHWLAAVAGDPHGRAAPVPASIRWWVTARRSQFARDGLAGEPSEIETPIGEASTLLVRHLFVGSPAAQDALLLRRRANIPAAPLDGLGLTRRETEILLAAARGLTNRQLGERFSISERTVEKHFSHIFEKLGVKTRTAAVSVALRGAAGKTSSLRGVN